MECRVPATDISDSGKPYVFSFTLDDFHRIRSLIYRLAGISLAPSKKDLVYSRLARRLRLRELDSFASYIWLLEQGDAAEIEEFINALTTNMTSFFREEHHFPVLVEHLKRTGSGGKPFTIWSCACSSGEEPYSIAIALAEYCSSLNVPVKILATDIDTKVLEQAKGGVYPRD